MSRYSVSIHFLSEKIEVARTYGKIKQGGESMAQSNEMQQWIDEMAKLALPRWDDLPELDLYMDQVVTLIERYLKPLLSENTEKMLTKSMVNNYVKLQLIPPPIKKQYSRRHLAFLIAITLLKQVVTIKEIKQGIENQANISGEKNAYNYLIEEQEKAIHAVAASLNTNENIVVDFKDVKKSQLALIMVAMAFAGKIATEKIVAIQGRMKDE